MITTIFPKPNVVAITLMSKVRCDIVKLRVTVEIIFNWSLVFAALFFEIFSETRNLNNVKY